MMNSCRISDFGERDHRAVDAVDVPLEGDDAEDEGEQRRNDQRAATANGVLISGSMKAGSSVRPFHSMKSGMLLP